MRAVMRMRNRMYARRPLKPHIFLAYPGSGDPRWIATYGVYTGYGASAVEAEEDLARFAGACRARLVLHHLYAQAPAATVETQTVTNPRPSFYKPHLSVNVIPGNSQKFRWRATFEGIDGFGRSPRAAMIYLEAEYKKRLCTAYVPWRATS